MSSGAMSGETEPVKLDFSYFSAEWQREFWLHVRITAYFDAEIEECTGTNLDVERRVMAAASPCIKPEVLAQIAAYYRKNGAGSFETIAEFKTHNDKTRFDCEEPKRKRTMADMKQLINRNIDRIDRACRECMIC
jgi:hypothetical protein